MTGYGVFVSKELREIVRTWRIWVLPAIMLFFALTGPILARFTPEIVGALAGSQLGHIEIPTPSYLDAYSSWIKNLSQITLFALIIIYGGIVSSETKSGTAILVLTKPVSRTAFVSIKAIVHSAFLSIVLVLGTLVTWAVTAVTFGTAPGEALWASALVWLVYGVLFITVMTLFSVLIGSAAGAAGAGIGAFVLLSIAAIWKPLSDYSPAGLPGQAASLAARATTDSVLWPVTSSLALSILLVALAALIFRRKEL
ncbi:MAG: ABC transporter permease subunit [Lacisediminihabitans sp.]